MSERPETPPLPGYGGPPLPEGQATPTTPPPRVDANPYSGEQATTITGQIHELSQMTVAQLRQRHLELFGVATKSKHKVQLFKKLAWKVQEVAFGGLSERAQRRLEELARDVDARYLPPRTQRARSNGNGAEGHREVLPFALSNDSTRLVPGVTLAKEYRGELHEVLVIGDRQFEYKGRVFRSLSGVAREIAGCPWSGAVFFGLKQRSARKGKPT
jgi:hypothetical protein